MGNGTKVEAWVRSTHLADGWGELRLRRRRSGRWWLALLQNDELAMLRCPAMLRVAMGERRVAVAMGDAKGCDVTQIWMEVEKARGDAKNTR